MNIRPITILFRHLASSFSPSFVVLLVQTPSTSSRFVISSPPWRTGRRSKGGTGKPFLTMCFCHSHPCVFGWNRLSLPSPSSQCLLLLRPLHFTSAPTRAYQTRSGILHVATWCMTRGKMHPHPPTRIPSPSPALSALQMSRASPVYLCVACSSMFDDDEAGGLLFHVCHSLALLPFRHQLTHPSLPFFGQCTDPSLSSPVPPPPLSPFFVLLSRPPFAGRSSSPLSPFLLAFSFPLSLSLCLHLSLPPL